MGMKEDEKILATEAFVKDNMKGYDSGHDWWHIVRVRNLAAIINEKEGLADPFLVDITALLHDTVDSKFRTRNDGKEYGIIAEFLNNADMSPISERVVNVIKNISFSNKNQTEQVPDPLLWMVQDADRLDAIGAIGIARAFNYGGFRNNIIFSPDLANADEKLNTGYHENSSTISHFYEKLLLLRYRMNTLTAKKLAVERHKFLDIYLKQFYKEWEFATGLK